MRNYLLPLLLLLITAISFQNCGQFNVNSKFKIAQVADFASTGGGDLQPSTDRVDPNCLSNSEFNACLFQKNPVASQGQGFTGSVLSASLDSIQTYGVKLTGISPTGRLENGTIRIETLYGQPISTSTNNLRYSARNDSARRYSQIATYYWLTRAQEYISWRTEVFPAKGKSISVFIDDTLAGWSPRTNSIHLKQTDNPMAWGPEIAVHFLGVANAHYATSGAISELTGNLHRDCGTKTNGCCTSAVGCARAISSGIGDYFAAMLFPQRPIIGETWANTPSGINLCGLDRNLDSAATRTAAAVYAACEAQGYAGEVSTLGNVYASIWWQVRKAAAAEQADSDREIDTIFMHHLALLNGGDTFQSALQKIQTVDQRLFNGRYSARFQAEFQARGL